MDTYLSIDTFNNPTDNSLKSFIYQLKINTGI